MKTKDFEIIQRHYYVDHPSSPSHREPYITSMNNQYSVLSRSHNPYQVLDHLNFQFGHKKQYQNSSVALRNESLENQMREWNRKQYEKENSYRALKYELRDLNRQLKQKEKDYEMQKMRQQMKSIASSQSRVMPMSMVLPMAGLGTCPMHHLNAMDHLNMWKSSCQHHHQCRCQCQCQCHNNAHSCQNTIPRQSRLSVKKYKPVVTQNTQTQTIKQIKAPTPVQASLVSIGSKPKLNLKEVMKLKKKKSSNLLRRFRVCAYAVYFCIYFKWFSFQFSLNRYNRFKVRYLVDSGKEITNAYKEVYLKLLGIQIPDLIRTAVENVPEKRQGNRVDISSLLKHQAIPKLEGLDKYKILSRDKQTLFLRCSQFIGLLFEKVESMFGEWEWGQSGNALGIGALDLSYMIDSYFLPHQLYLMTFHDGKGYAKISPEHERVQVMIKMVVKMLLYNICFQLDNNREWLDQHEKELDRAGDKEEIFIFLQISSKMTFIICQYLYEKELKGHDTNYDQVSQRFKIEPCNPLVYSYSIRKRRQLFKNKDIKDSNLLIFGIQKLDEVNDIMQQTFFKDEKNRIISSINSLVEQVLTKLGDNKRELFSSVWEETLDNEYIVLRGMKKIMRSTRYYPFVSGSAILSNTNLQSKSQGNGQSSYRSQKKTSRKIKKQKSNYNVSETDSIMESADNVRSTISKTSILNRKNLR